MGLRGTKPQNKHEKIAAGVRKSRINFDEPEPDVVNDDAPTPLRFVKNKRLAELWQYYTQLIKGMKVLTVADLSAIEELVYYKDQSERAEIQIKKLGEVLEQTNKHGEPYLTENPWLGIRNKANDKLMKLYTQFGLTPAARTSLKVTQPKETKKSPLKVLSIKTKTA